MAKCTNPGLPFLIQGQGLDIGIIQTLFYRIFTPGLIGAFALLGIFPLLTKRVLKWINKKKLYANYIKPKQFDRGWQRGGGARGLSNE